MTSTAPCYDPSQDGNTAERSIPRRPRDRLRPSQLDVSVSNKARAIASCARLMKISLFERRARTSTNLWYNFHARAKCHRHVTRKLKSDRHGSINLASCEADAAVTLHPRIMTRCIITCCQMASNSCHQVSCIPKSPRRIR